MITIKVDQTLFKRESELTISIEKDVSLTLCLTPLEAREIGNALKYGQNKEIELENNSLKKQ